MQITARESPKPLRCPYCHDDIDAVERTWACPECATEHHLECARLNGACTLVGCEGRPATQRRTAAAGQDRGPPGFVLALCALALVLTLGVFAFVTFRIARSRPHVMPPVAVTPELPTKSPPVLSVPAPVRTLGDPLKLIVGDPATRPLVAGAFSENGRIVLVRGSTLTTFEQGRPVHVEPFPGDVSVATFTPDGKTLALVTHVPFGPPEWRLSWCQLEKGLPGALRLVATDALPIERVVLSPDGTFVATFGGGAGRVLVRELATGRTIPLLEEEPDKGPIVDLALAAEARSAIVLHERRTCLWRRDHPWPTSFPSDHKTAALAGSRGTFLVGRRPGEALTFLDGHGESVLVASHPPDAERIAVSADGARAAVLGRDSHEVVVVDAATLKATRVGAPALGRGKGSQVLAFSSWDSLLAGEEAVVSYHRDADGAWNGAQAFADRPDAIASLVNVAGQGLRVGRNDGRLEELELRGNRVERSVPVSEPAPRVEATETTRERRVVVGREVAAADGDGKLWVYAENPPSTAIVARGLGLVTAMAAHPEGRYVATAGIDGIVRLFDIEKREAVAGRFLPDLVTALAFGEDDLYAGTATGEVFAFGMAK